MYEKIFSLVLSSYFIPMSEACSGPCQTIKMECFAKIVNGFAKRPILDV